MSFNLLTNPDEALLAMAEMEEWPEFIDHCWLENSMWHKALNVLQRIHESEDREKHLRSGNGVAEIYGSGGMNRYIVLSTGEVCFSRRHAWRETDVVHAQNLGFKMF